MTTKPSDSVSTEDDAGFEGHEEIGCSLICAYRIVNLISCIGNEFMETEALRQPSCEDNFRSTIDRNNFVSNISNIHICEIFLETFGNVELTKNGRFFYSTARDESPHSQRFDGDLFLRTVPD